MRHLIDTCSLSAEITGIAMIILGLSNQLDDTETDVLTPAAMKDALFWSIKLFGAYSYRFRRPKRK